jgi:8-oxo-dGTP diphosphatase
MWLPWLKKQPAPVVEPLEECPRVGIGVIAIDDGRILLGERVHEIGGGCWQCSGGSMRKFETFELAALRELKEETGLWGHHPRVLKVTNNIYADKGQHYVTVWVLCEVDKPWAVQNPEPDKCKGWKWHPIDQLPSPLFEASGVLTEETLWTLNDEIEHAKRDRA